ncbi:MAG: hypothetical protein Fur0043_06590 [Anaerolineales bacterium]
MFSSLRSRLWLSYAALIGLALGILLLALGVYLLRNPLLYRQTLTRLRTVESAVAKRQEIDAFGRSLPEAMERAATLFDVRLLLFDAGGNLLKDTDPSQPAIGLPRQILPLRKVPMLRDAAGQTWLYTRQTLDDGSTLLIAAPRPHVPLLTILRDELLPVFIQGGGIALLFSLALAFLMARWVADPLQRIVTTSQHVPVNEQPPLEERGPREVRELTRAFNAMIARVQASQKSQRDFVANVSHELKTPLTSIQGFAQAILDGIADTPESRAQAAEVIYTESARMYRLVLDLLDLARLDAGTADLKMEAVDVNALLNGMAEKFSLQAQQAGVTLQVSAPPDLPPLLADGDRLAQVLTNLVDNALKHTPSGGQVTLEAHREGAELILSVADNGTGIPAQALPHIFERFYQADASRSGGKKRGAGLGLAIAHEIVAAHGGRISLRSQEGQGTTFYVHLPLAPSATTVVRRK